MSEPAHASDRVQLSVRIHSTGRSLPRRRLGVGGSALNPRPELARGELVEPVEWAQPSTRVRGFTLLELLVVIVLIAALSVAFIGGIGQSRSVALQAGQSAVSNLIAAARSRAMANGNPTRLLVNQQLPTANAPAPVPPRYLRYLALQEQVAGTWTTVADAYLPDGVYVLPNADPIGLGSLFSAPGQWVTARATTLKSLALTLSTVLVTETVNSTNAETWAELAFSPDGRPNPLPSSGAPFGIVLTVGRALPPGGASPFVFENAENVRGLVLGNYGVPVLVNDRSGF